MTVNYKFTAFFSEKLVFVPKLKVIVNIESNIENDDLIAKANARLVESIPSQRFAISIGTEEFQFPLSESCYDVQIVKLTPQNSYGWTIYLQFRIKSIPYNLKAIDQQQLNSSDNWSADYFIHKNLFCKCCNSQLTEASIQGVCNIPSNDWSELLDFWACHNHGKDDDGHHHEDKRVLEPKRCTEKLSIVDNYSINIHKMNLHRQNLTNDNDNDDVTCSQCNASLGIKIDNIVKLKKHLITIDGDTKSYINLICWDIIERANQKCLPQFLLYNTLEKQDNIILWPLRVISSVCMSSNASQLSLKQCSQKQMTHSKMLKVFYKLGSIGECDDNCERLWLPNTDFDQLKQTLAGLHDFMKGDDMGNEKLLSFLELSMENGGSF